tara:strand:+ start:1145 stop:1522 length:378 start_codon:yes stop_codon:yes gene_type:complete
MNTKKLILKAIEAQKMAKAPYSQYPVGAALLTTNNNVIMGCNIESKAYPTTLCAERVAIFSALAQGHTNFKALALITLDGAFPCGACRQIIYEYTDNISIYIATNKSKKFNTISIDELLPHPFGK